MLTLQEIFNKVRDHLLTQGERSMAVTGITHPSNGCAYRGDGGLKCAAGVLIADEHYHPHLEQLCVTYDWVIDALILSGVPMHDETTSNLVRALQQCHDFHPPSTWRDELFRIAMTYHLNPLAPTIERAENADT